MRAARWPLTGLQDLEEAFDDEIAALKIRMEQACEADNAARESGKPALQKLKMLPEVVSLLSRNTVQHSIVDPDTNFLQSVKYFLEPLGDGSLPAYNIQRDLFTALTKLPIEKEALLSSGIGKIVLFYTKSKKPEIGVKRIAERLMGEWSRPILKRSDDYKQRKVDTREYNHQYVDLAFICFPMLIFPTELLNSPSAPLAPKPRNQAHPNVLVFRNVKLSESVFLPNPTKVTEPEWRPLTLVTLLRREVLLILTRVSIRYRDQLVLVLSLKSRS